MSKEFNWNAIVDTSHVSRKAKELEEIADELYGALLENPRRFSDWEYQFISDMYAREDMTNLSEKQEENLRRLQEKYL